MEKTNREFLEWLFENNKIDVKRAGIFEDPITKKEKKIDFDKVEGMMLGLAIGDALGITTESIPPDIRKTKYGEIRDYIPNKYCDKPIGFPSDDTQLAFWTLEIINEDNVFIPDNVAKAFCNNGKIFGIGSTVKRFINNYKNNGFPWYEAGVKSAGNGALMRIAPMIIPHLTGNCVDLWADTALCTMITHNDSAAISSAEAFVYILCELIEMKEAPKDPMWWIETYLSVAKNIEIDDTYEPRGGEYHSKYKGTLSEFIEEKIPYVYEKGLSVFEANRFWFSGAYLLETVPMVLYILMKHANDPEKALIRAVNDTKDNDTVAAIVGAAVGALHGKEKLPKRWIENLSGRTKTNDDGKVFEDLKITERIWFH
ncbi:MAG: ADP-ribosylglycohydrolase family protein [Dissulfuribacterales bacterium]